MYSHFIWDFDGTLFDTYPAMAGSLFETLRLHGCDAPYEEVYSVMKQSVSYAFDFYAARMEWSREIEDEYASRRKAIEADVCMPFPGVTELLRAIVENGGKNYIYTHRGATLWPMLEKHGIKDLFVECVTSENGFARKPAPDGLNYLVEKYAMAPDKTVMIGDRELDILSGKNAGIKTCAYCDGTGEEIVCADNMARNIPELRKILLG